MCEWILTIRFYSDTEENNFSGFNSQEEDEDEGSDP